MAMFLPFHLKPLTPGEGSSHGKIDLYQCCVGLGLQSFSLICFLLSSFPNGVKTFGACSAPNPLIVQDSADQRKVMVSVLRNKARFWLEATPRF